MNKAELLAVLKGKYQRWQALLAEVGPARMDRPGVNGAWSMKDLAAHLTGWQGWLVARLQAAARGQPEPPPPWPAALKTDDEINAWLEAANRGRTVADVLGETERVFQQLFAIIASLPDDVRIERVEPKYDLVRLGEQRFPVGEFFDHFEDDHGPDVRAWLARNEP